MRKASPPTRPGWLNVAGLTSCLVPLAVLLLVLTPTSETQAAVTGCSLRSSHLLLLLILSETPLQTEVVGRQRRQLNQFIFRKRQHRISLSRAIRELQSGNLVDGFEYLQRRILDPREDAFVWIETGLELTSSRTKASRILSTLSPEKLSFYERLYGAEADRLLRDAREASDYELLGEVARRFFHTKSGFRAIDLLATHWMDHGNYGLAARYWQRLITSPSHRKRVRPLLLFKTALACRLSGQLERADQIAGRIGNRKLRIGGRTLSASEWHLQLASRIRQDMPSDDWLLTLGNRRRNRSAHASPPYLKPVWTARFADQDDAPVSILLANWKKQQATSLRPSAVANSALVVGGNVIIRDFKNIRARNLLTGDLVWSYRCQTSVAGVTEELEKRYGTNSASGRRFNLQEAYIANATLGTLASDGRRIYAIDSMDLSPRSATGLRHSVFSNVAQAGQTRVSREANRLIALDVRQMGNRADAQMIPVWSIGGAVGTPGWFFNMDNDNDGRITQVEFRGDPNEFKKIDSNTDGAIKRTEAELTTSRVDRKNVLAGHFFLGPPLPVDGRLYVVTEADRQLNLVALRPETGALIWSQGIGFVDRPIELDSHRYSLSCSPTFSDGVIVCPTQLGILVGVDSLTGSLLWAYYYGDEDSAAQTGRWSSTPRTSYGHAGFSATPVIDGQYVICLPRQSSKLHCIDLYTGKAVWKTARQDAEYVGAVSDGVVFTVGRRYCRGISLLSGQQQWSKRLGMPSGRGVLVGKEYLVPLEEGRVATMNVLSGEEVGFTPATENKIVQAVVTAVSKNSDTPQITQPSVPPGNLIACANRVISVSPEEIRVFPQAAELLTNVEPEIEDSIERRLLAAKLELILGNVDGAKSHLVTAIDQSRDGQTRLRAEELMRELLYFELRSHHGDEIAVLDQLDRLSKTPAKRGRYLIQRAESQLQRGDFDGVLNSTQEYAGLRLDQPLPLIGNMAHRVSAAAWIPSIVGRLQIGLGPTELDRVMSRIDLQQQDALVADNIDRLERFLSIYSQWPQAAEVRRQLAEHQMNRGQFQRAEFLLLENRHSTHPAVAAEATRLLVELWDRIGLATEAAALLVDLDKKYPNVVLDNGKTGSEYAHSYPANCVVAVAFQRLKAPSWAIKRVNVSAELWTRTEPKLTKAFSSYRRRFVTPHQGSYQLLDKGTSTAGRMVLIDKQSGVIVGKIGIPPSSSYPSLSRHAHIGHFFPLGSKATMNGISLIEHDNEKPLWTTTVAGLRNQSEILRVGPASPSFCSFQGKQHLTVVNPVDGRIRWQRTDLEPASGLLSDPYAGLIGDDKVLVLFSSDRSSYTVFRTTTGEELRHGKLDIDVRLQRRVFGRRLFYVSSTPWGKRIRIWDPLEDHITLDVPVDGRVFSAVTPENELVLVLPDNRIQILDVATGTIRLNLKLSPSDLVNLNYVRAFRDHRRYYVNLQRSVRIPPTRKYSYYASDTFLSAIHVQGDLFCADRESGRLLWKRSIPQRSVIQTSHLRMPFLITMSRMRDRWAGNRQSLLVEVIDTTTGETLGLKENIFPDRMLHLSYNPQQAEIQLLGQQTLIRLKFGRRTQRLVSFDEAL